MKLLENPKSDFQNAKNRRRKVSCALQHHFEIKTAAMCSEDRASRIEHKYGVLYLVTCFFSSSSRNTMRFRTGVCV